MRIYRRDPEGAWWCDFWHAGKRVRRSSGTTDKEAARRWADELKASLWRRDRIGERPSVTWDAAVLDWLAHHERLRSLSDRKDQLRWASTHLKGKPIASIDRELLAALARKCADGRSGATVNRYMAAISAVLGHAVRQGYLDSKPRTPKRAEPDSGFLWATRSQALRLVAALPPHLGAMARFALATGLRQHNVTHLEWRRVNLDRRVAWVEAAHAKGKRALTVPLNDEAIAVLQGQRGKDRRWVFPWRGKPVGSPARTVWKAARRKAGLPAGFTWHDLRHTWASWHVQSGTPLAVLQQLGGWRTLTMVMRYAHLAPEHLAAYAANSSIGTKPVTQAKVRRIAK